MSLVSPDMQQAVTVWPSISRILRVPHTDVEYQEIVRLLDDLIDQVGENEDHPLASLMEVLGVLVERYEDEHVPEIIEM
jgi:HTH-type transcriptional regulator / antitoxin HigA